MALRVLPAVHLRGWRLAAEVTKAERGGEELLAVYRRELERRLRRWSRLRVLAFVFALFQLSAVVMGPPCLEHRGVLSLSVIEGLGHARIAEVLGIPEGTVWSRLHQARRRLVAALNERNMPPCM